MDSDPRAARPAPGRILAVKLSSMGDIIHATPCLRALRAAFPRAQIRLAVESRWADVVRHNPYIDGLIECSSRERLTWGLLAEIRRLLAAHRPFDFALDLQGTRRSAAWVYLSRARIQAGRGRPRPLWKPAMLPDLSAHAVVACAEICRSAGIPVGDLDPEIWLDETAQHGLDAVLGAAGLPQAGWVLLNPFSRWKSKSWSLEAAAEFAAGLRREFGIHAVVTGGPEDREQAEGVLTRLSPDTAVSLAGKLTLGQALCLYRRARLMVSCDSGPMHAAATLGTPVVALFGPTFPERTGPWGAGHRVVQVLRPPHHHTYRNDPGGVYMAAIRAGAVLEAVREALAAPAVTSPARPREAPLEDRPRM